LHLGEGENDRAHEQDEQQQAGRVERRAPPVAGTRLEAQHEEDGAEPERDVDEEDRRPAESLGEVAARDRPEGA
jgi:hypothetical protein